jgi:acyl carrier protein/pimeloyl-ACP methyl ester carboxylesterase
MEQLDNAGRSGSGNETELRLCVIWSELLGIEGVGIDDDFLDLGGDSFLAIRMLGLIRSEFGRNLEMPDFFQEPSVRALARLIDGEDRESRFHRLVPVRYDREKPPTHTFDGTFVFAFSSTQSMERLQLRFPVYTVTIDMSFGDFDYSEDIHELAERHVEELLEADPVGPYRLAGYSLGGFIVHEMACCLHRKGRPVEFLVLLDPLLLSLEDRTSLTSDGSEDGVKSAPSESVGQGQSGSSWHRFLKTPFLEKPSWIWQRRGGFRIYTLRAATRILRTLFRKGLWPWRKVPIVLRDEWALLCKDAVWSRYKPEPYDGDMTLFVGNDRIREAEAFWPPLVEGKLDLIPLPVDDHHHVLSKPAALTLIRDCIDELLRTERTRVSSTASNQQD